MVVVWDMHRVRVKEQGDGGDGGGGSAASMERKVMDDKR